MFDKKKRMVCSMLMGGIIGLAGHAAAGPVDNGDFETGGFVNWTKTGTAFNDSPTQSDGGGLFSGWQNDWYVNTFFSGETATGTLRSDTFTLIGPVDFLIAGWSAWGGGAFNYNYVVLKRASDNLELARVWTPNQNGMVAVSMQALGYIGQDVYIEVVDDASGTGYAWIAVDAFSNNRSGHLQNGDFETGDLSFWATTGAAFDANPTQNYDYGAGTFYGWQNDWYVNTWFSGEPAVGTLQSDTFKLTGTIDFLITGWSSENTGASNYNYVVLNRASDDLELARAWTPNQTPGMTKASLDAAAYLGQDVYIKVVDDGNVAGFAWIAVDAFSMEDPARATNPTPINPGLGSSDTTLSWISGVGAVEHEIYLGTDLESVTHADSSDATGIYRGRQAANSYETSSLIEGTTYYWRVDEIDSGSNITWGTVWSFTVTRPPRDLYSDTWVATDALGRKLPGHDQCGSPRAGKTAGMFYFTWHGAHSAPDVGPNDVTKYIADNPFTDPHNPWADNPDFGTQMTQWWGEPEAGYFLADDEWVIRRNISMLTDAGVEVLVIDATNAFTYYDVYSKICEIIYQMRIKGFSAPIKILFNTHGSSPQTVTKLYDEFYSKGVYSDLWFMWEGKPLMLGWPDGLPTDAIQTNVTQEIRDFFSWRECWFDASGYEAGYLKWIWGALHPQDYAWNGSSDRAEEVSIMPATHPVNANVGKSYQNGVQPDYDEYHLTHGRTEGQGLHFAEQLQRGLELDPEFFFITGWNEWTASVWYGAVGKFLGEWIPEGGYYFVDSYNAEYNRDLEPMKDGYADNYYFQMVDSLRRYKGVRPPRAISSPKTISMDGDFSDWADVEPEFRDTAGDTFHRNHDGFGNAGPYTNSTGRNDLLNMKVARDDAYVYFYAETEQALTPYTDPAWMLLYIDADQSKSTGWEGYDYLVNWQVNDPSSTTLSSGYLGKAKQGWWKLDEGSGTTAIDSSGSGNNGVIHGSPVWNTEHFGKVIQFDGIDDYIDVPINVSETNYAVSLWFKTTSPTIGIFEVDGGGFDRLLYLSSGNLFARVWNNEAISTTGINYADGQWHHVVHTFGGSQGGQKLYVDGQLSASGLKTFSDFTAQTSLRIGFANDAGVGNQYFSGSIDEVRIYNEALGATDVQAIFSNTPEGTIINGDIQYAYSGNGIEIRIPRFDIGQGSGADPVAFDFHWADNSQKFNDIIEFSIHGDSAPNRRFDYRYQTRAPTETTLLSNGFETGEAYADWDIVTSQAYSGTHSLEGSEDDNSGMVTPTVSTAGKDSFRVSFKYKLQSVEDSDNVSLYYSDGTNWDFIEELGTAQQGVWLYYTDVRHNTGSDAQYFNGFTQFHIQGAGLDSGDFIWIDDFEVIGYSGSEPVEATAEYYAAWAASYGLADTNGTGNALFDFEPDGLDNLGEYALGGNPTIDDAATILPSFEIMDAGGGSNVIDYVYNRRRNPASLGLTYGLNTSTNLQNPWEYVGTTYETGSADIDPSLESVTNTVPVTTEKGFIDLEIRGDF